MSKEDQKIFRKSKQRTRILELLRSTKIHPTADWLYEKLKNEFPRLSLGTVYRNLSILIEQNLAKKIHFGSTFDRFEANIKPHYHLICKSCRKIFDFEMPTYDDINFQANQITNFTIHHHKLEFFGICEKCKTKD
jgi:Fur family peroxide stress response transcriptional regulator